MVYLQRGYSYSGAAHRPLLSAEEEATGLGKLVQLDETSVVNPVYCSVILPTINYRWGIFYIMYGDNPGGWFSRPLWKRAASERSKTVPLKLQYEERLPIDVWGSDTWYSNYYDDAWHYAEATTITPGRSYTKSGEVYVEELTFVRMASVTSLKLFFAADKDGDAAVVPTWVLSYMLNCAISGDAYNTSDNSPISAGGIIYEVGLGLADTQGSLAPVQEVLVGFSPFGQYSRGAIVSAEAPPEPLPEP